MKKVMMALFCAIVLFGCAGRRLNTWNEEDARALTRVLAAAIVSETSPEGHAKAEDRAPALLICPLENRSEYSVSLPDLEEALARELLLSGKVRLIRPRQNRSQPGNAAEAFPEGQSWQASGADARLRGWLDVVPDRRLLVFRLTLEIVDSSGGTTLQRVAASRSKPLWTKL